MSTMRTEPAPPPARFTSLPDLMRHAVRPDVIDLALGVPDDDPPGALIDGAIDAMRSGRHQYVDSHGLPSLREAASRDFAERGQRADQRGMVGGVPRSQTFGVRPTRCDGGFFLCADISQSRWPVDVDFAARLMQRAKVLIAPGRMFFADPARGRRYVRVCLGKSEAKIAAAIDALSALRWSERPSPPVRVSA